MVEVTTADKIAALVQIFQEPKFYITMGVVVLVLAIGARMNHVGRRAGSMVGRLGLVIHWAALFVAVALFIVGVVQLATAQTVNDNTIVIVGLWWATAFVVWLTGKGLRFVLTGPLEPLDAAPPMEQRALNPLSRQYREQQLLLPRKPAAQPQRPPRG
jgi:hypothetical protein